MSLASGYRCSLASPPGRLAIEKEMMAVAPLAEAVDSASAVQGWAGIVRVCARSQWRRGAGRVARPCLRSGHSQSLMAAMVTVACGFVRFDRVCS